MIWPWAIHTVHGSWTRGTSTDFWSGMGLALVGLAGFGGWYAGLRQELIQRSLVAPRQAAPANPPPADDVAAATPAEDLDRLLRPLAESVLQNLSEQLASKDARQSEGGVST